MMSGYRTHMKFRKSQRSSKKRLYSILESCLERFECHKENEFHFTSPQFDEGIPPFACQFWSQPSHSHILAAADEDGHVVIQDTNIHHNPIVKEWSAHKNAIFDIAWSSSSPRLVTASGDQSAAVWDVQTATCLASFKQHRCSLKSVSFRPRDGHVFATGSRDGSIMMWDDRCEKRGKGDSQLPVTVINEAHVDPSKKMQPKRRKKLLCSLPSIDSSNSVSVVLFQREDALLSAGAADGIVKLWDLRMLRKAKTSSLRPFHQFPYAGTSNRKRGFSSLAVSGTRTQLFASCTDSVIYEYNLSGVLGQRPSAQYRSHLNSTFFVRAAVSPDDLFLLSGSSDSRAYIWRIGESEAPPMTLVGHEAEVTSVAWCPDDFTKVVTCSDDNTMRIWKLSSNVTSSDDGQSSIIGKAEKCQQVASLDSQRKSETSESSQPTGSPGLSVGIDGPAIPSGRTSGDSPVQSASPLPSSTKKKRKFSLRDWVTRSPPPSRGGSPVSPSKRARTMSTLELSRNTARNDMDPAVGRKCSCDNSYTEDVAGSKRARVTESSSLKPSGTEEASGCAGSSGLTSVSVPKKENGQDCLQRGPASLEAELIVDSRWGTEIVHNEHGLDKENSSGKNRKSLSPSKKGIIGQRSPLKDDIPMNRASPDSSSQPVKKNLAKSFPGSSLTKSSESYGATCHRATKQQKLEQCVGDKRVVLVQKSTTKRRGSAGTIDRYFMPLLKRKKSES